MPRWQKWLLLLMTVAVWLPVQQAQARSSARVPPLTYLGAAMGMYEFSTPEKADSMMQRARDSGLNSIRANMDWHGESVPPSYNLDSACNAARSADQYGLKALVLDLMPQRDYWQANNSGFVGAIGAYDARLFSGCLSPLSQLQIMWMIGNEPNVKTFCGYQDPAQTEATAVTIRHRMCAKQAAMLYHAAYPFIKSDAKKYGVQMSVIGLGLSTHQDPMDFISQFCQARQRLGYKTPDMDYAALHPYILPDSVDQLSGYTLVPQAYAALQAKGCLGSSVQMFFSEGGWETVTPDNQGYTCYSPPSILSVPDDQYAALLGQGLQLSRKLGSKAYFNELLLDQQCLNPGWQSGWFNWDGTPKPFLPAVRDVLLSTSRQTQGASRSRR
jgi:hypothetical protein